MPFDLSIPALPEYSSLHVLLVHFPVALFVFVVPFLLLLAVLFTKASRQFAIAAGVLLIIGAASAFLTVSTGEAAEEWQESMGAAEDQEIHEAIEQHAARGEMARNAAAALAVVFLIYLIVSGLPGREWSPGVNGVVLFIIFLISLVAALHVANTAHSGGALVHTHGLLANLEAVPPLPDSAVKADDAEDADDDNGDDDADEDDAADAEADDSATAPISST